MSVSFRTYFVYLILIMLLLSCRTPPLQNTHIIRIKGSDTMLILVRSWPEAYMTLHPGVSIYVEGGGSASGINALIDGNADIAMASRLIRPQEASKLARKYRSIGISFLVAKDALSIYLNPANKIPSLSLTDIADIFSGKTRRWTSGPEKGKVILPAIRPRSSGTHFYIREHVLLGGNYGAQCLSFLTTRQITDFVARHSNAIGYGGRAYGDSLYHVPVDGVTPSRINVINDRYPLSRYLYFYTIDTPQAPVRRFIDWTLSPTGQEIVEKIGYVPLWE